MRAIRRHLQNLESFPVLTCDDYNTGVQVTRRVRVDHESSVLADELAVIHAVRTGNFCGVQ